MIHSITHTQALSNLHGENAKLEIYLTLPQDRTITAAAIQRSRLTKAPLELGL